MKYRGVKCYNFTINNCFNPVIYKNYMPQNTGKDSKVIANKSFWHYSWKYCTIFIPSVPPHVCLMFSKQTHMTHLILFYSLSCSWTTIYWNLIISLSEEPILSQNVTIQPLHPNQELTLSQTTNFRLFQTVRGCRRQFHIWWKLQKVLQKR